MLLWRMRRGKNLSFPGRKRAAEGTNVAIDFLLSFFFEMVRKEQERGEDVRFKRDVICGWDGRPRMPLHMRYTLAGDLGVGVSRMGSPE